MIGKNVDISVTSVLQTTAGKMIFGKWDERLTPRVEAVRQVSVAPTSPPVMPVAGAGESKKSQAILAERPNE
jgi:hypothetical protein